MNNTMHLVSFWYHTIVLYIERLREKIQ